MTYFTFNAANRRVSRAKIPNSLDEEMDQMNTSSIQAGLSIRNGPYEEMEVDGREENCIKLKGDGLGKRKARKSAENNRVYKEESSEGDEDVPLVKRRRVAAGKAVKPVVEDDSDNEPLVSKRSQSKKSPTTVLRKPPKASETAVGESDDSDTPISTKLAQQKARIEKKAEKDAKQARKTEKQSNASSAKKSGAKEANDNNKPVAKPADKPNGVKSAATKKRQANSVKKVKPEPDDDDIPLSRKVSPKKSEAKGKAEAGPESKKLGKGKGSKKEETPADAEAEQDEEEYKWWENQALGDGTKKWTTLEHSGVVFPPPYEPLPGNVKLRYDGTPVTLHPDAEEVAGFFGTMLSSTVNVENPKFVANFFADFQIILGETGGATDKNGKKIHIKEFKKCDFTVIFDYYEAKRAEKKALPPAEKKALKAEKDASEAPYLYCLWDGRKEKVGNFRVEPPGLFRGRGEHPKTGKVKKRVLPEQITINISKDATVPPPPPGHRWKEIKHDDTATWLAMWQENVNKQYKYVMLAANSSIKGQSDFKKFEKARELKKHIDGIRKDYQRELKAELMADRQRATAVYLIDRFALRAGNEKGDDEADTVGCCSLKFEHVTLKPPSTVVFDFLGKDSIRFYDEFVVDAQVFKNLKIFKKPPKREGDEIFDRLTTVQLNKHLANYMPGLSAKVFRTYNASYTMANVLKELTVKGSIPEMIKAYNDANRRVAILCNHKRTVGAAHANQMEKMTDRIKGLKYQKWRVKQMMISIDLKIKKKRPEGYFNLDDDLTQEWIEDHQAFLVQEMRQKIEKKFQKENEKLAADGQREMKATELEERLQTVSEQEEKYETENKTKKVKPEGKGATLEKMEESITKLDQKIETLLVQAEDKESNKEVALGTSKINYIDPRLTVVFSKKFGVPVDKFFSRALREKFAWAMKSVDKDWEF
ncbi:MAG: DNA topoisomerase 1 [Geoglossum umbratile]|nr:MAG: DNA topoisomerase 1 [Geoglossum umbratile]